MNYHVQAYIDYLNAPDEADRIEGFVRTPIPQKVRQKVFCRDLHECRYCGARDEVLTVDHIYPAIYGCDDEMDNLITACRTCNTSKGARLIAGWAGVPGRKCDTDYALKVLGGQV